MSVRLLLAVLLPAVYLSIRTQDVGASAARAGSYAALGASETYGQSASPVTRGYAYLVAQQLHARRFVDAGIPGASLGRAYQHELAQALAIRPSLATLFFGYNDIVQGVAPATFEKQLSRLATALVRAHARVLIIGLPALWLLPAIGEAFPGVHSIVALWNGETKAAARASGATYLDLGAYSAELASHPGYVAADGLHPSNSGHRRLAEVVVSAIRTHHLWGG